MLVVPLVPLGLLLWCHLLLKGFFSDIFMSFFSDTSTSFSSTMVLVCFCVQPLLIYYHVLFNVCCSSQLINYCFWSMLLLTTDQLFFFVSDLCCSSQLIDSTFLFCGQSLLFLIIYWLRILLCSCPILVGSLTTDQLPHSSQFMMDFASFVCVVLHL